MTWVLAILLAVGAMAGERAAGSAVDQQAPGFTPTSRDREGREQPVTSEDLRILQRAGELLKDESVWNRADDRECSDDEAAGKRSLFCALQKACIDVVGTYDHRRVALQEARFAVADATRGQQFEHRLKDFNNLPTTRLADIRAVLQVATDRVGSRLQANTAVADCQAATNLLAPHNCGFDTDAKGWTALPGASVSHDPADRGVLKAVADSQGSLTIQGPCVAAQGGTTYRIGARLRLAAGTAYFCSINVFQYADDRCSAGQEPLGSAPGPPGAAWSTVKGSATTGAAKSLRVTPVCSGQPGFVVQFDDFVLGS